MNSSLFTRYTLASIMATSIALSAFAVHAQGSIKNFERVTNHDRIVARMQGLSDSNLKQFYLHCSRSVRRSLHGPGVAICSIGYEILLNRTFGGDFYALLAWSRSHPDDELSVFDDSETPVRIP